MIRAERLVRRVGDRAIVDGVDVTIKNRLGWITDADNCLLDELAPWRPATDLLTGQRTRPA